MEKHILIIMGSPRREGNSNTLAEILMSSIQKEIDIEKIVLS